MNADDSLARTCSEELPWLAFLYVSEELTPDEVVDFEERLLTDQSAREAVAEAMKMAEGLWMASALEALSVPETLADLSEPARKDRTLSRWALWIGSTIAAAGLAFSVGWWFAQDSTSSDSPVIAQPSESLPDSEPEASSLEPIVEAEELVGLWSNSRSLIEEWDMHRDSDYSSEEMSYREAPEPEEDAFAWMLAVLSDKSPDASGTTPDVMEN